MFRRLSGLQWVNEGYLKEFGAQSSYNFGSDEFIAKLAGRPTGNSAERSLRESIYNAFRKIGDDSAFKRQWPMLYGDTYGGGHRNARTYLTLSKQREQHLRNWRDGNFVADWNPQATVPHDLSEVPLAQQPAMLTEAAMTFCLADAFHPGCELTWPMRVAGMYEKPFRFKKRTEAEPDLGETLNTKNVFDPNGPLLGGQTAGDLTRWMAVPWQGDTVWCRSGYDDDDPYMPTFWPARVPNHVLSEADYEIVKDQTLPLAERQEAFSRRAKWWRFLKGNGVDMINQMMDLFGAMGVVVARKDLLNDPDFPGVIYVENNTVPLQVSQNLGLESVETPKTTFGGEKDETVSDAGWESQAQKDEFMSVFNHHE